MRITRKITSIIALSVMVAALLAVVAVTQSGTANAQVVGRAISNLQLSHNDDGDLLISWDTPELAPRDYRVMWAKSSEEYPSWTTDHGNVYPAGTATTAAVNVDEQSAQLRDFLQGRYFPINVGERAKPAGVPEKPGDHCAVQVNPEKPMVCVEFLWNQTFEETQPDGQPKLVQYSQQLPQGTGLDGWMVFEVPQGTMIRSLRWAAGDTVTIDF